MNKFTTNIRKRLFSVSGAKRVCFRHVLDEESIMKFSCFPTPSILGQRGSINLISLSRNDESNVINVSVIRKVCLKNKDHIVTLYERNIIYYIYYMKGINRSSYFYLFVERKCEESSGNKL